MTSVKALYTAGAPGALRPTRRLICMAQDSQFQLLGN